MTGEALKDYLQQMYNVTGSLPGGTEGTVDSLNEEALSSVRSILTEMSQNTSVPSSESETVSSLTGEDVKSLLSMMLLNIQGSLFSSDDSFDDSLFPDLTSDYLTQALTSLSSEDENSQSLLQQALLSYQQNILSL